MSNTVSSSVLLRIKRNPYCVARYTTSIDVLHLLMQHPNADVRLATICNELMSLILLSQLAKDQDHYVRYSVAIHPLTSKKDLTRLSYDQNALVRKGVNENTHYYYGLSAKSYSSATFRGY